LADAAARPGVRIERASRPEQVEAAAHLYDGPPRRDAVERFVGDPTHHLLLAYDGERPVGFVSGVEMTHPDKGTEMFLYELAVDEDRRRRGVGRALVEALTELARARGCYDVWVLTEEENEAAVATYRRAGGSAPSTHIMIEFPLDDAR
jgi:ribosomal protein S18 acetylase RimI-like enzyme